MRRAYPESTIMRTVFIHLRTRAYPGVVAWHPTNEGKRSIRYGARLKAEGMLAGVSDICAVHNGKFFALEVKAPGGRPTEAQLAFISAVNSAGGYATWCDSLDRALNILTVWGLLKPATGMGAVAA